MTYSYKIVLDNFFEAREAYWSEEPLTDNPISAPNYGKAPSPWNLYSAIDPVFKDHENRIRVPFTDVVKTCSGCCGIFMIVFSFLIT